MATKFPLQLNSLRFFVNPTNLRITKAVNFAPLNTQNGVKYQIWYDAPELLTISGASAGKTAYKELVFLKRNFERTNKLSELFYKTRIYKGFITNMEIDHSTSHPNQFNYTITFQLLFGEKFAIEDFSLTGNEKGIVGRTLEQVENFINEPLNKLESSIEKLLAKL
jgi:hypothetical protein